MRFVLCLVLAGCGSVANGDPTAAPATPDPCVKQCVQSRQMEARAAADIEADCRKECAARR